MTFSIPSQDETRDLLIAALRSRFPNLNLSKFSGVYKLTSALSLGVTDNHYHISKVAEDLFPDTATGDALSRWGVIVGTARRGAVGASRDLAIRIYGTATTAVAAELSLTHVASGLTFKTASSGTVAATGYVDLDLAAVSTGAQTNLPVDTALQFAATPAGLEDDATTLLELTTGTDQESDASLRVRVLQRIGEPAAGGNRLDYVEFGKAAADYVSSVYVYPNRNGLGTVDIACLKSGSGSSRTLDSTERATVLTYVDTVRPVSATARVLETVELATDVEVTVLPHDDPNYTFDWNDSTAPIVSSFDSATRTVTLTLARPSDMATGDSVCFNTDSTDNSGSEYAIESLSSTDAFVLSDVLPFTPVATDLVYSGGPVVEPVRQSIIRLIDGLGTANPDSTDYGSWQGNLRHASIFQYVGATEVNATDAIANSEIELPAITTTEASDANADSVELITPGLILVRELHI